MKQQMKQHIDLPACGLKIQLPRILRETRWTEEGLARTASGLLVPAYFASQFGFSHHLRENYLEASVYRRFGEQAGVLALCPFRACGEFISQPELHPHRQEIIEEINYGALMPLSKFMVVLHDGGHASDDGASGELGWYAAKEQKPVIGIRSDCRRAEDGDTAVNRALHYFYKQHPDSRLFEGPDAMDRGIAYAKTLVEKIRSAA